MTLQTALQNTFESEKKNIQTELETLQKEKAGLQSKVALMNEVGSQLKLDMKNEVG